MKIINEGKGYDFYEEVFSVLYPRENSEFSNGTIILISVRILATLNNDALYAIEPGSVEINRNGIVQIYAKGKDVDIPYINMDSDVLDFSVDKRQITIKLRNGLVVGFTKFRI